MLEQTTKIVRIAFHPLLVPMYSLLFFAYNFDRAQSPKVLMLGIVCSILFTILIPLIGLQWLYKKGMISSISLPKQKDRATPYLLIACCLTACGITLSYFQLFPYIPASFTSGSIALILCTLVNFWKKVSVHTTAMGCWLGSQMHMCTVYPFSLLAKGAAFTLITTAILTGVVCSSRIASKEHSESEVYIGLVLGMLTGYGILLKLLSI